MASHCTEAPPRETRRAPLELEVRPDDKPGLLVELSFSSEEPIRRVLPTGELGFEVLGHGADEIDLSFLNAGAPVLRDHVNTIDAIVGRVERAWVADGKGRATVRLFDTGAGAETARRVRAGEVAGTSIGFDVHRYARSGERDGLPVMRAVRWAPREISLVAVPADPTVGVGRSAASAGGPTLTRIFPMPTETTQRAPETRATESAKPAPGVLEERSRIAEIRAIAQQFDVPAADVDAAIGDGTSVDRFRRFTLDLITRQDSGSMRAGASRIAIHAAEAEPYSLVRAAAAMVSGDWRDAGFEREVGEELRRIRGRAAEGLYVPTAVLAKRDLITTANAGALIGTEHLDEQFIEVLRPEVQVAALGATVLMGLRENVSVPRQTGATAAEWIAEGAAAAETRPTFDSVPLALKQLSARSRLSRRQLKQSLPALDDLLRNDLRRQIAVALDAAAIAGAGTTTEPQGILGTPGIGSVAIGADGGALTWAHAVALMAAVEGANVPLGGSGFLSNHAVKAAMLTTEKFAGGGEPILSTRADGASIAGQPARFTSLVPADLAKGSGTGLSALVFGVWSDLLIGQWGGVDLIVDDKTESPQGNVRITAHSEWDIAVRHPESFAAITDIAAG